MFSRRRSFFIWLRVPVYSVEYWSAITRNAFRWENDYITPHCFSCWCWDFFPLAESLSDSRFSKVLKFNNLQKEAYQKKNSIITGTNISYNGYVKRAREAHIWLEQEAVYQFIEITFE